jgi:hypothetical protein
MKKVLPHPLWLFAVSLVIFLGSCRKENKLNPNRYGVVISFKNFDFNNFKDVTIYRSAIPGAVTDSLHLPLSSEGTIFLNREQLSATGTIWITNVNEGVLEAITVSAYVYSGSQNNSGANESLSIQFNHRQNQYFIDNTNPIITLVVLK